MSVGNQLQAMEEPYHIQGSVFAHRDKLDGSLSEMIRGACQQAEAEYGASPTVCLLSGWDYAQLVSADKLTFEGLEVIPVSSLFPGNCLVGWPEGEAPGQPLRVAAAVRKPPPSEQVFSKFQVCLKKYKGRDFPLKRGSAPWRKELAIAKKLLGQCESLPLALQVVEVYFTADLTSWQNPLSLSYILKATPALLRVILAEKVRQDEMQQQAAESRAQLAAAMAAERT